jgi:CBS domain-containing protein
MRIRDIMKTEVVTLQADEELSVASDIMHLGRIRHLPIVQGEQLVGIISQRDLFKASLSSILGYGYADIRDHLKKVAITDVMVKKVITVGPDAEIPEAGRIMVEKKIGCLPVIEKDRLVGMVTETDIIEYYVTHHDHCTE